jgi:ADP-ribosylglycohydrolase
MDMVGVGVEFEETCVSNIYLRDTFSMMWSHPYLNNHNRNFTRGTPTDDTSQATLIIESLVKSATKKPSIDNRSVFKIGNLYIDLKDFGTRLRQWATCGHPEFK